jgi:Lhr-like helicase
MPTKRRYLSPKEQATVIERQGRRCACDCGELLEAGDTKFDHDIPLWTGEDTPEDFKRLNDIDNFRALKNRHHLAKTNTEAAQRAKEKRVRDRHQGKHMNARQRALAKILNRDKQLA